MRVALVGRRLLPALLMTLSAAAAAEPHRIHGIGFGPVYDAGTNSLPLHGLGMFRRYMFRVYAGALYIQEGIAPRDVLKEVSKRLEIEYVRNIPAQALADATRRGVEANARGEWSPRTREDVARLNTLFEDVKAGDRYALTYIAGEGLYLERNGTRTGFFDNSEFARAVFSVWLGDAPLDEDFKRSVLAPLRKSAGGKK